MASFFDDITVQSNKMSDDIIIFVEKCDDIMILVQKYDDLMILVLVEKCDDI